MEVFLVLNAFEIQVPVERQEQVILKVASGDMTLDRFTAWLRTNINRIE